MAFQPLNRKSQNLESQAEHPFELEFATLIEQVVLRMMPPLDSRPSNRRDLAPSEARALLWIARHNHCLMSELARGVGVPVSTATRLVDRLELKRFLVRTRSAEDRRAVRVSLSPTGQSIERKARKHGVAAVQSMMRKLSPPQQKSLLRLLRLAVDS